MDDNVTLVLDHLFAVCDCQHCCVLRDGHPEVAAQICTEGETFCPYTSIGGQELCRKYRKRRLTL